MENSTIVVPTKDEIFTFLKSKLKDDYQGIDVEEIKLTDNLIGDIGLDSLDTVELVVDAEQLYGMQIPDEEMYEVKTIGEFVDVIHKSIIK